jgi:hypothetical protein
MADHPADVEKVLLRRRAFLEFNTDPFPLKLDGVHGRDSS